MPITHNRRQLPDPHTAFFGHTHDYANLRIFGSTCWVHVRDIPKSAPQRAHQGIFIGYKPNSNTPSVFVPSLNSIIDSGDVRFDEQRRESLQPSISTSESNIHNLPTVHDQSASIPPTPLSQLNNEDFITMATRNIRDFQCGSETPAI